MKNLRRIRNHSNRPFKCPPRPWVPECKPGDMAMTNGKFSVAIRKVNLQTGQMTDADGRIHGPGTWRPWLTKKRENRFE